MTAKKDEVLEESRNVRVTREPSERTVVTPVALSDQTPVLNDQGQPILSQAIRDEQEKEGYAPDIQPKAGAPELHMLTGVTGTAPGGVGAMQPTGNVIVANAASISDQVAVQSVSPVPDALGVEGLDDLPKDKHLVGDNPATAVTEAEAKAAAKDRK